MITKDRELPPPLEMICLNILWSIGEGNVQDVRRILLEEEEHALAYTTVLTLLERLTQRSAVSRRKEGRGYRYQPTVERDKLRRIAVRQLLDHHFDGRPEQLKEFLGSSFIEAQAQLA